MAAINLMALRGEDFKLQVKVEVRRTKTSWLERPGRGRRHDDTGFILGCYMTRTACFVEWLAKSDRE